MKPTAYLTIASLLRPGYLRLSPVRKDGRPDRPQRQGRDASTRSSRSPRRSRFATARSSAVGTNADVLKLKGPKTRVIDAGGKMVLPGLYDSHVHPVGAAHQRGRRADADPALDPRSRSPTSASRPRRRRRAMDRHPLRLPDAAEGSALPDARRNSTRLAPKHPVLYHAGPAGIVNSMALKVSGVTKDTPNPTAGMVVKDPATGEPTGMLRNAYGVLKGVPGGGDSVTAEKKREAVKKLFRLYNEHGLTSIADRNAGRGDLDLYLALAEGRRADAARQRRPQLQPGGTREEIAKRLRRPAGQGRPRRPDRRRRRLGPHRARSSSSSTAACSTAPPTCASPGRRATTYQITEDDYRGLLFIQPEQLKMVVEEAAKRNWQVTAHTAGEGAMDVLLDAYEFVNRIDADQGPALLHHARQLPVAAQPRTLPAARRLRRRAAGLALQGRRHAAARCSAPERMRWFQPYKTLAEVHDDRRRQRPHAPLDPLDATNPWNPWLGIWVALTRKLERGGVLEPEERLTREQALRLYTINNAYLHHEEKEKGSLEAGQARRPDRHRPRRADLPRGRFRGNEGAASRSSAARWCSSGGRSEAAR